jgi:hypothetical protein
MLDPSYLRSIRDGILSGNIEANNNEALPDGLVGLYDKELFPPTMKWKERKETLDFFLVFALAQKEITADFAAEILGDEWYNHADENTSKEEKRLQRVNDLIQLNSKRFSPAGSGKYRLYHERFRVYVLQKVSQQDITRFNARFIALCERALETSSEKEIPDKESYALEFISSHFFISAMRDETECLNKEHAAALKKYAYDQQFWERQYKSSKGFEWSKRMLNQMMRWASKFNEDEEVIECALNKVDLYHQEQNDAPRIVQLVADGDIETALERIEKFGGNDQKQKEKEFKLIVLSLIDIFSGNEYTESDLKQTVLPIAKKLRELTSDFYWPNAVDSYTFFKVCFEMYQLGVEPDLLAINDFEINFDWITDISELSNHEIHFLIFVCEKSKSIINAINICCMLSAFLQKNPRYDESNNLIEKAISLASTLKTSSNKEIAYVAICKQMVNHNENESWIRLLTEINFEPHKEEIIKLKIAQLSIDGNHTNMDDIIDLVRDDSLRNKWSQFISLQSKETDFVKRILNTENLEFSTLEKIKTLAYFLVLNKNRLTNYQFEDIINNRLLKDCKFIKDPVTRTKASLIGIRALHGKLQNNENNILHQIIDELETLRYSDWKNEIYKLIAAEFFKQGNIKEAKEVILKSLKNDSNAYDDFSDQRDGFLISEHTVWSDIAEGYIEISNYNAALKLSNQIKSASHRRLIIFRIIDDLLNKGHVKAAISFLQKTERTIYKKYIGCKLIQYYLNKSDINSAKKLYEDTLSKIINFEIAFEYDKLYLLEGELNQFLVEMIKEKEDSILFFESQISQILGREKQIIDSLKVISKLDSMNKRIKIFEARNDGMLLKHLMNIMCLNQLFFSTLKQEKLNRYNRTLKLQWAIDIKNQLPN